MNIYRSPGSSYRPEIYFNLACSLYIIGSPCKDVRHYHFFSDGNLTLIWEQRRIVLSFGMPAVPLRIAGNDGYFKREILGCFSKKDLRMPCSRRNFEIFDVEKPKGILLILYISSQQ